MLDISKERKNIVHNITPLLRQSRLETLVRRMEFTGHGGGKDGRRWGSVVDKGMSAKVGQWYEQVFLGLVGVIGVNPRIVGIAVRIGVDNRVKDGGVVLRAT